MVEEKSVIFSTIDKHAGPSYNYIARMRRGPFEREDGASVHPATTEARFMPA